MSVRRPADPSAYEVLERWRDLEPQPTSGHPFTDRDAVTQLLIDHLDSYAYERLPKPDRIWWEHQWSKDEEAGAFTRLFGPEWIVEGMDEFLGWFLIRKVAAGPEELGTYPALCLELVNWMEAEGLAEPGPAAEARARAARAAEELPRAAELGSLLDESGRGLGADDVLEYEDWVDQRAQVVRSEPGALWFRSEDGEEIGPVRVPERAVEIAKLGWGLSAAGFGRTADGWYVLEMGNVYPD